MKRIFYLYRDFTQMLGKHRAYIKPALFEDALHFGSNGLFDDYYGNTEDYRPGRPLPAVAYQITTAVNDALHPFMRQVFWGRDLGKLEEKEIVVGPDGATALYLRLGQDGQFSLPADWVHPTSLRVGSASVEILDDNEVGTVLTSLIDPPTLEYPKAEVVPGGFRMLAGANADEVQGKYLARPRRAVYAIKYVNDVPQYDDENSVDTQWPEARHNQLLTRMLQYPGLTLRDSQVQQTAAALTDRGA